MSKPPVSKQHAEQQRALALHKSGAVAEAAAIYQALLQRDPKSFDLNHLLGMALLQQDKLDLAVPRLQTAVRLNAASNAARSNLALAYAQKARALHVDDPAAALAYYDKALALKPDAALYNNKGAALRDVKRLDDALASFDQAIALDAAYTDAFINKANTLRDARRPLDAIALYDHALTLTPYHPHALTGKAWALQAAHDDSGALSTLDILLVQQPADGDAHLMRATICRRLKRYDEALQSYLLATQYAQENPTVYLQWAGFLIELERFDGAVAAYDAAIRLSGSSALAYYGRAEALRQLGRTDEAAEDYARAFTLEPGLKDAQGLTPGSARAYYDRAETRRSLKRIVEAVEDYDQAFKLDPAIPSLQGIRLHSKMHLCDWRDYADVELMRAGLRAGQPTSQPFPLVGLPATAEDQRLCAQLYAASRYPLQPPVWTGQRYNHDKIRIAYLSADFHSHATAHLMAGLFEAHDRDRFEWTAISYGQDDKSPLRQRLQGSFDHFIDVRSMGDESVSRLILEREIDILVDLKGYTQNTRFGILTRRCAPVQVTYIGYPGTTASAAVDYAIADHHVLTPEIAASFSEKIVYLPHSYQVNDRKRAIAAVVPSRSDLGLPADGFVFCSFNQNYKITPDMYDVWMRILVRVPNSVLWLFSGHDVAAVNLRAEAEKRGVRAERIIFATHMKLDDHLARLGQADLFLDTLPCNAHTTASDALWAGLPVLTVPGDTFAGRVAASLLMAHDMPELVMPDLAAYEEKAVEWALSPDLLQQIRQKLGEKRLATPLFDTELFARHIEAAYVEMYRRAQAGEGPADIDVKNLTA